MMNALAGGTLGALLGQAAEPLGAGRRAVLDLVGQGLTGKEGLDSGSALLEALGAEPGGLASSLGGFGVDTLADPLSYLGMMGGALMPAAKGAQGLEEANTLGRAAMAAGKANAGTGMELGQEAVQRMGRKVLPEEVAAAGPRMGLYNRDMVNSGGLVDPGIAGAGGKSFDRAATKAGRGQVMAGNALDNDAMLGKAMAGYGEPYQGQSMALPGMMLDPNNPLRSNVLAQLNPEDAMTGIAPLLEALQAKQAASGRMGGLDLAALLGAGGGALGGGVYGGMNQK